MLDTVLFVLIGALFMNGLPHFTAGAGGQIFRSPFGRHSSPKTNLVWGMVNFLAATILFTWRISVSDITNGRIIAMVVGMWLVILMFGTSAKRFFDDRGPQPPQV